jgi:RNA recognition motif-containing protein
MVSSSLSSYSSSELGQDIQNLISERREAENLYSKAMLVGRLEQCLDAVKTALSASEEETNVAQMRADEDHARTTGKISLKSLCFYIHNFIR